MYAFVMLIERDDEAEILQPKHLGLADINIKDLIVSRLKLYSEQEYSKIIVKVLIKHGFNIFLLSRKLSLKINSSLVA